MKDAPTFSSLHAMHMQARLPNNRPSLTTQRALFICSEACQPPLISLIALESVSSSKHSLMKQLVVNHEGCAWFHLL